MSIKAFPLLVKPKACRPIKMIPTVHSEPSFCSSHYDGSDSNPAISTEIETDSDLDGALEKEMRCKIEIVNELRGSSLCSSFSLCFRPPSTRPTNPIGPCSESD